MPEIHVYTDGSCANNGYPNAKAGYAVYFGEGDSKNEYRQVFGKQSNNTGELTGFIRAIELSTDALHMNCVVHIHTDSEYVIKCISSYGDKLAANGWKTSNNKQPPNKELVQKAYTLFQEHKTQIKIHHVKAHTANTDEHSIGNREADRLANLAIGNVVDDKPQKIYLDISFANKDNAKEYGAKWDKSAKKWYYMTDDDEDNKAKLHKLEGQTLPIIAKASVSLSQDIQKHYIKIAFANKNQAKKLGARWDATVKSWYYTDDVKQGNIDELLVLAS